MRKAVAIITTALLIGLQSIPVWASESAGGTPTVYMIVTYADTITPQTDDMFVITYRDTDTGDEATIEFDGSDLAGKAGGMNIDYGSYEITDIKYTGSNEAIQNESYAVNTTFRADNYEAGSFEVGIGNGEVENMKRENAVLLIANKDDVVSYTAEAETMGSDGMPEESKLPDTNSSVLPEENNAYENETAASEVQSAGDTYEDDYEPLDGSVKGDASVSADETKNEVNEAASYEESDNTKKYNPSTKALFFKGLPALIMGAIGALAIYIIHKKGIL